MLAFTFPQGTDWFWIVPNVLLFLFWVWALWDCVRWESDVHNAKTAWLFGYFVGAFIYLFFRRPRRTSVPNS